MLPLIGMAQNLYCSWCVLYLANFYSLCTGKFAAAISGGRHNYLYGRGRCRHNFRYRANKSESLRGRKKTVAVHIRAERKRTILQCQTVSNNTLR